MLDSHRSDVVASSRDALELAKVGKREVLKVPDPVGTKKKSKKNPVPLTAYQRRFGLASTVGLACTLMLTWEAVIMFVIVLPTMK
jgi:choline transport protein